MKRHFIQLLCSFLVIVIGMVTPAVTFAQGFPDGTTDGGNPLPIQLVAFTATKTGANVALAWTTASETNNSYFSIERATNGLDFTSVGKVMGNATTASVNNYSFVDAAVPNDNLYYRLRQVDADGKTTVSAVIAIKESKTTQEDLTIYPNPVSNHQVMLTMNAPTGVYAVSIFSVSGTKVYAGSLNNSGSQTSMEISLPATMPRGMYIINLANNNGQVRFSKLLSVL